MKLRLISAISQAGSDTKANEDRYGHSDSIGFVVDGATGLGEKQYMAGFPSDAAWFAELSAHALLNNTDAQKDTRLFLARFMETARKAFFSSHNNQEIPRYAWPSASIALISLEESKLTFSGLGDCTAYVGMPGSQVQKYSALQDFAQAESAFAQIHVAMANGIQGESLLDSADTLEQLRKARSTHNTPEGSIWTLGLEPAAAEHLQQKTIPVAKGGEILICSDGFSALEETYQSYSPGSFVEAARSQGLKALYHQLRDIEQTIDPLGKKYPRFKRSDDATALFLSIE